MRTITIIGKRTDNETASEIVIDNESPIASILSGELLLALHDHVSLQVLNSETATTAASPPLVGIADGKKEALSVTTKVSAPGGGAKFNVPSSNSNAARKALTVVTTKPDADGEIQLTDVNKFKLYLMTGMTENDTLILKVMIVGEVMRP